MLDSDYFEELYVKSGKLDKYPPFSARFGTDDTFFTASSHEHHRRLRNSVAPFFSKRKITDFQPVIQAKLTKLCSKVATEYAAGTDRALPLHRAWTALTGDVVTEFCFAKAYDHLDSPDFAETFHEPMHAACESSSVLMQFPWLWPVMNSLPDWLVVKLEPKMHMHIQVQHVSSSDGYCSVAQEPMLMMTFGGVCDLGFRAHHFRVERKSRRDAQDRRSRHSLSRNAQQ